MTHDVIQQLEAYGAFADAVAPAISTDELDHRSAERIPTLTLQRRAFPNWVVAVGAAAAVFILIGGVVWLIGGSRSTVIDEPMPVTTSVAVNPTTIAPSPPVVVPDAWNPILATTTANAAPPAATCPAGTDPNAPGPVDQERPDSGFVPGLSAAFDQRAGRIVYVAASGETWTFDVCANTWHHMNPTGTRLDLRGAEEAGLVYDVDSDVTVALGRNTWVYDAKTNTWTDRGPAPYVGDGLQGPTGAVYDTVSGLIITTDIIWDTEPVWEMWAYDVDTDVWSQLATVPLVRFEGADGPGTYTYLGPFAHDFLGFSQELDRFISVRSNDMTLLADPRTGDATEIPTQSWWIDLGWQNGTYGQADDTVYVTAESARICGFDTDLLTWTSCFVLPEGFRYPAYGAMVGDPVNNRLVLVNGVYGDSWESAADDIWAVDLDTGEWTQILSPSDQ
jgi:hypothetical protein